MSKTQLLAELLEVIASKPLITRKDLALRYSVTLITVDNWRRTGKLPRPVYLPGCRFPFWRPCDLQRFEANCKLTP